MAPLSPASLHVRKPLLLVVELNERHKKSQGGTSVSNVANSVFCLFPRRGKPSAATITETSC